jgi:hypothetical protein
MGNTKTATSLQHSYHHQSTISKTTPKSRGSISRSKISKIHHLERRRSDVPIGAIFKALIFISSLKCSVCIHKYYILQSRLTPLIRLISLTILPKSFFHSSDTPSPPPLSMQNRMPRKRAYPIDTMNTRVLHCPQPKSIQQM